MSRGMFSVRNIIPKNSNVNQKSSKIYKGNEVSKRKDVIPKKLREEVWIKSMGRVFEGKCCTTWCTNTITVFDFESGHNIPESKGGKTTLENLFPICSRCNKSMGNQHTFDEWCKKYSTPDVANVKPEPMSKRSTLHRYFACFFHRE